MKTLSIFTLLCCILFVFPSTAQDIVGSGKSKKEIRNISSFENIEVGRAFHVELTQGKTFSLAVEADDNILPYIQTEVKDRTLYIHLPSNQGFDTKSSINLYITMPVLKKLDCSGAASVYSKSLWETDKMDIELSAAAELTLQIDVNELELDLSGATNTNLAGKVNSLEAEISAAAKLNAGNLSVKKADIDMSGASKAELKVTEEIKYDLSGASKLTYNGSPRILKSEVSTAASVRQNEK